MALNRIINNAYLVVDDMLKGWLLAHAGGLAATDNPRVVKRLLAPESACVNRVVASGQAAA